MGLDSLYFLKASEWQNHQRQALSTNKDGSRYNMLH